MAEAVLIVIPCLNEIAHLDALIGQMLADAPPDALLVIADGGSTDGSVQTALAWAGADPRVRLLNNPARLQSAGLNAAVAAHGAGRRFLIRIDAHAAYPADYVARLIAAARATGADSVVVPMRTVGRTCFQIAAAVAQNARIGSGGSAHRTGGPSGWIDHGHHALLRIAAFERIGGYDAGFSHNEDAEYDHRLAASGGRVWMQGDLTIDYHPRKTLTALFRQYANHGRGRARTVRAHRTGLKARQWAPALVAPSAAAGAAGLLLGVMRHPAFFVLAAPAGLWIAAGLIGGAAAAAAVRAPPCGYGAGVAALAMHLGWSTGFLRGFFAAAPDPAPVAGRSTPARSATRRELSL